MRKIILLAAGVALLATSPRAQIDCGPNGSLCSTQKYGLGNMPDFRFDKVPADLSLFDLTHEDFAPVFPVCEGGPTPGALCASDGECGAGGTCRAGVSIYRNQGSTSQLRCNFERGLFPYTGQIRLRELTGCTPTTTGPTCAGGPNAGQPCHLVPPDQDVIVPPATTPTAYHNIFTGVECPQSSCQDNGGGCRVEIPISDGGGVPGGGRTPPAEASDALLPTILVGTLFNTNYLFSAHASQTWGGSSTGFCVGGPTPSALCNSDAVCGAGGTCNRVNGNCQSDGSLCTGDSDCGGAPGSCRLVSCNPWNFREKPSSGTRYLLSEARRTALGLPPGATFVRWDYGQIDSALKVSQNTALRSHSDDSTTCCNSSQQVCGTFIPGSSAIYPVLNQRDCSVTNPGGIAGRNAFSTEDSITADWVFTGGRGSPFATDPNHILPGQIPGICKNNRQIPCTNPAPDAANLFCTAAGQMGTRTVACCTGLGTGNCPTNALCTALSNPYDCCTGNQTGTCGTECPAGDSCDRTEAHRAQINPGRTAFGEPRPEACSQAIYELRGMPDRGCTLQPQYFAPGDPGSDCGVFNYGRDRRLDDDCNGVADFEDKCPFLSEWDQAADTDGDCDAGVGGACRGDECECGDQNGDGNVNVADIVDINLAIFGQQDVRRLCDGNSDAACNVSDIVAANGETFRPDSSTCAQITSSRCGNNVRNEGEACDNGARCTGGAPCDATGPNTCPSGQTCNRLGGDGCNTACRVERNWSCTGNLGEPSVCTPN